MAGPGSTTPRIRGPARCGQRLWIAYTHPSTAKSAISVVPTRTSVRPPAAKSPGRATATQPFVSGDIAPQADDGLGVRVAERAVLAERVDAVTRALEVRLHPREVAPPLLVLVADDPGEPALDRHKNEQ